MACRHNYKSLGSISFSLLVLSSTVVADDLDETLNNEIDNIKAMNGFSSGNLLAVPIPLSNPTLGTGLQLALLYLHPEKENGEAAPNTTTGIGAMYTSSDSKVLGIFHDDYLLQDRLRIKAAIGAGELNLDYFGSGRFPSLEDDPIEYKLSAQLAYVQVLGRVPATENWFVGMRSIFMQSEVEFDLNQFHPDLPELSSELNFSNLSLVVNFDDRDNNYYPTTGRFFQAVIARDDESWGSDFNFTRLTASYNHYIPISDSSVLAMRAYTSEMNGNAPFFLLPSLKMRGFAGGRYQDDAVISAHAEWRHKLNPRWGYIISAEAGRVADSFGDLNRSDSVVSVGAGIRWQITADQPMHLGLDIGFSNGDSAIYLQIGEKF